MLSVQRAELPERFFSIRGGLGTRLRAICAYAVFARYLGLPLLVHWAASPGFEDVSYYDLKRSGRRADREQRDV